MSTQPGDRPLALPPTLLALAALLTALAPPAVTDRLFHRRPNVVDDYFVVARPPALRGPDRIRFRDVILLADHAKTISFVRNYRGKYAVVRRKPGVSATAVEQELNSLLGGRVVLTPLSGLWLLRLSLGEALWLAVGLLFAAYAIRRTWRQPGEIRYWAYGLSVVAAGGVLGVVVWAMLAEFATRPNLDWTLGATLYGLTAMLYLGLSAAALVQFWQSLRRRCRRCLHRLRLPLEEGVPGSMVVAPDTEATVCIYGHGTRTVGRWQDEWRAAGSFWEELEKVR
jgi:hypothetical protein